MDKYYGLQTLMESRAITSNEAFAAYYQAVLAKNESQELDLNGFETWDIPQVDFTYEQLELEDQITAMATYVDLNSEAIPFGTRGINLLRGSIPRQKARFIIGENDYRKQMMLIEKINTSARMVGENPTDGVKAFLVKTLFGGLSEIQSAHVGSLSYQVNQMKSAGGVTLTDANNPRGIKNITFSAYVPTDNTTTLTTTARWFTNAGKTTEGTTSQPVKDLRDLLKKAKDRYTNVVLEVDEKSFYEDMQHTAWKEAIGRNAYPLIEMNAEGKAMAIGIANNMMDDEILLRFKAIVGSDVEVRLIKTIAGVEKWDDTAKKLVREKIRAFNANTYLARPAGQVGIIKNVTPLRPDSSAISTLMFNNKGIIEYRYDARSKTQDWSSELTALAVPTRPKDMLYLKTY